MIKLILPTKLPSYLQIIDECCKKETNYKQHVLDNKHYLLQQGEFYKDNATLNNLYHIPKLQNGMICNKLTSDHMIKLYNYCLRDCRCGNVYETIINLAKDPEIQCPFCGGINSPSQIDHFLPKAKFGHFSIFPYNLIPICKDCNTEYKKDFYPVIKNQQLIHPYLDNECFFCEQWLYAEYIHSTSTSGTIKYFVDPPTNWSDDQKAKIKFHFDCFNLAARFSEKASGILSDILTQMEYYKLKGTLMDDFEECSLDSIINNSESKPNNWKRVLYQAVKDKISYIWQVI